MGRGVYNGKYNETIREDYQDLIVMGVLVKNVPILVKVDGSIFADGERSVISGKVAVSLRGIVMEMKRDGVKVGEYDDYVGRVM